MSKNLNEIIFWQKLEREGVKNKLSKIETLHFVWFITQSDPTNSQRLVENVHFYFMKASYMPVKPIIENVRGNVQKNIKVLKPKIL